MIATTEVRPKTQKDFQLVAIAVRDVILNYWKPDSCILSARLGGEVLRRLHVPSRPLTVHVIAMNQSYVERYQVMRRWPTGLDDSEWWTGNEWSVGIGAKLQGRQPVDLDGGPGWAGHLVTIAFGRILVDWSLDQLARPAQGIVTAPLAGEVTPSFLAGKSWMTAMAEEVGGAIRYQAHPTDSSFRKSNAWRGKNIQNLTMATDLATLAALKALRTGEA